MQKTKTELKVDFRKLFNQEIAPALKEYEEERKKNFLPSLGFRMMLFAFLAFFISAFGFVFLLLPAFIVFLIGVFIIATSKGRVIVDYDSELKTKHMKSFLSIFGNFEWSKFFSKNYFQLEDFINQLNIFPPRARFVFDDIITGFFDGVNIDIIETNIGGFSSLADVPRIFAKIMCTFVITTVASIICLSLQFYWIGIPLVLFLFVASPLIVLQWFLSSQRCVIIKCKMNKQFKTNTYFIETLSSNRSLLLKNRLGYEKVTLEDVNFNNQYTVYSKDQVEARYLLTTAFIERFQNIKTAFNAKFMRAEFKDEHLVLLIRVKKDLFSMGTFSQQTTYLTFLELFEELYSVLELVEQLKLNQQTGL